MTLPFEACLHARESARQQQLAQMLLAERLVSRVLGYLVVARSASVRAIWRGLFVMLRYFNASLLPVCSCSGALHLSFFKLRDLY